MRVFLGVIYCINVTVYHTIHAISRGYMYSMIINISFLLYILILQYKLAFSFNYLYIYPMWDPHISILVFVSGHDSVW